MEVLNKDKKYMVFKKDGQYGAMYSIGLSKKDKNGEYTKGYLPVRFRNGVELDNQSLITIKQHWLDFYLDKDKKTIVYVFINEYEVAEKEEKQSSDPFKDFAEEKADEIMELPF